MTIFACHKVPCKGGHRAEIPQLFKYTPLFQPFIILALYLQHMESLTEIMRRQAISAPTPPIINFFLLFFFSPNIRFCTISRFDPNYSLIS